MPVLFFLPAGWVKSNSFFNLQALVVAGGHDGSNYLSSVLTLLPGVPVWTPIASLPRPLKGARASIVGGRVRLTGGRDGSSNRQEVMVDNWVGG